MVIFIVRRLLQAVPVLFLSSFVVFVLVHLIPGDTAGVLAGPDATPQKLDALRAQMGLDQPLPIQYIVWLGNVLRGDLGTSTLSGQPITVLILGRAPATLQLTFAAM